MARYLTQNLGPETKKPTPGSAFFHPEISYFLVSVVVVVVEAGGVVVVVVDDGVVVVVEAGAVSGAVVVVLVVVVLLAGGGVGASAGFTSTFVVVEGAGVTSVFVQPITPKARRAAARIYGDFIVRVP